MSLARFLMALRARWRLALSVLLAVLGLTLAVSLLLPTRYTATAMVLVDARAADPVAPGGAQPPQASPYMAMQVDLIQSERVARAVIAAFALPENAGKGAIQVEGKMAELLHLEQAQRLVAVAEQIAAA